MSNRSCHITLPVYYTACNMCMIYSTFNYCYLYNQPSEQLECNSHVVLQATRANDLTWIFLFIVKLCECLCSDLFISVVNYPVFPRQFVETNCCSYDHIRSVLETCYVINVQCYWAVPASFHQTFKLV